MPDSDAKSQAWASHLAERKKDEEKSKHNFDQSDPYAMLCNEWGIGEDDMSWMDDL